MYFQQGCLEIEALDLDVRILVIYKQKSVTDKKKTSVKNCCLNCFIVHANDITVTNNKLFFIEISLKLQFLWFGIYHDIEIVDKLAFIIYLSPSSDNFYYLNYFIEFWKHNYYYKIFKPAKMQKIKMTNTRLYITYYHRHT